jgi:hypothetical protein
VIGGTGSVHFVQKVWREVTLEIMAQVIKVIIMRMTKK